jgi:peptide methionine sulfoxide reductase msrA/msrB
MKHPIANLFVLMIAATSFSCVPQSKLAAPSENSIDPPSLTTRTEPTSSDSTATVPTTTTAPATTTAPTTTQTHLSDSSNTAMPSKEELRKKLTPDQFNITQEDGTEQPFKNAYWNNHDDGIYVDLITGDPLFSSLDKYDSGTGWPSFTRAIDDKNISFKKDDSAGMERNEVRSATGHLGHVFDDGPTDKGGKRFCMNSGALKFIPLDKLKGDQRYDKYLFTFAQKNHWEIATLAGGCFWGMEHILHTQPGVLATQTGYAGGKMADPKYEDVSSGETGHAESVQVLFDPKVTSYENLVVLFFKMHDPTTKDRQENDVGSQYRSAIFYANDDQKKVAEKVKARAEAAKAWKDPIVTEITKLGQFWRAEDHHQYYLINHPQGYSCHFVRNLKF